MPTWKKGSTEFTVRIISHKSRGYYVVTIPMPVIEALGEPRKIAFVITEKGIQLEKAGDEETTIRHL